MTEEELNEIKQKVEDGLSLQPIFDELKKIQSRFKDSPLSQGDRSKVWTKLDTLFKTVKEKRYGGGGTTAKGKNAFERLQRRYEGLLQAIQKMDRSIERDKKDLNFENQRIAETQGQLEAQIRQAKIQMIEERIRSKGEKLQEMHQTREVLEQRMSKENERLAEQAEKERIEKAKQEIKDKIAKEIKDAAQAREEELGDKLEHAVALIHEDDVPAVPAQEKPEPTSVPEVEEPSKEPDTTPGTPDEPVSSGSAPDAGVKEEAPKESFFESISDTISESLEDLGDTVKAVAKVVGERIEDAIGDIIDRDEEE